MKPVVKTDGTYVLESVCVSKMSELRVKKIYLFI